MTVHMLSPEGLIQPVPYHHVAIGGASATFADVVHLTCYVAGWSPDRKDAFETGMARAQAELGFPDPMPPFTLVGVEALYAPDILVEIQAVAVVD